MKVIFASFCDAVKGVRISFIRQRNLKVHTLIAFVTIGAGMYFNITAIEWCILLFATGLVIGLEIVNSSIDNLIDLVTSDWKPLATKVKDMAAGAVMTASIVALTACVVVFRKYCVASPDVSERINDAAQALLP